MSQQNFTSVNDIMNNIDDISESHNTTMPKLNYSLVTNKNAKLIEEIEKIFNIINRQRI